MTANEKPGVASTGLEWNDGWRQSLSSPHDTTASTISQVEPRHIGLLRQQVDMAERNGDYQAFWQARRAFLLEQARFYFGVEG